MPVGVGALILSYSNGVLVRNTVLSLAFGGTESAHVFSYPRGFQVLNCLLSVCCRCPWGARPFPLASLWEVKFGRAYG